MASRDDLDLRCAHVRQRAADLEVGVLLVTHLPNVFYLTGLRATAAAVLIDEASITLVTDSRYMTAARTLAASSSSATGLVVEPVAGSYDETIRDRVRAGGHTRLGVESEALSVKRWSWLRDSLAPAVTLVPTEGVVESSRIVKDAGEQSCLRTAGRMLAAVVPAAIGCVRAGRAERGIAAEIEHLLVDAGFEDRAFETIVASGENSALPHARPGGRQLGDGDLVVLDFGGVYDGYCVDLTRTMCVGRATADATRFHTAVLAAQTAAIATVRPGVAASAVDAAARQALAEHDLADAFGHGTGHGLGVEVHEAPRIAPAEQLRGGGRDVILEPGMVCTVEPGVYVPGTGGVRIEDDILVTSDGCEVLTEVSRELVVR